jgi:hypothetical protein
LKRQRARKAAQAKNPDPKINAKKPPKGKKKNSKVVKVVVQ